MWNKKRILIGALVSGGLLISSGFYPSFYTRITSLIAYPALVSNAWVIQPINRWLFQRKSNAVFAQQLADLKKAHEALEQAHAQLQAQLSYFNGIKEIRAFSKRFEQGGTITRVLARTFSLHGHFFFIDAGERDNVTPDTIVLHNNALVGKVVEVYPWYSKVCLITDSQCKVGAYCAPGRVHGIHEGCNIEGHTQLSYVDHLSSVHEGDLVLSSGEGLLFPEGFTLGKVASVVPDGLYQQVSVAPACNLKEIEYCLLLAKNEVKTS